MTRRAERASLADDPAARVLDEAWIRRVHVDLLGRPPFEAERERWRGRPLPELLDELVGGLEFWREWLHAQLYYFLLVDNFRPASESVLALPTELQEGRIGVRDAIQRIALSPSFDRRNPGADTFVTVVMEQLLGIEVQKDARQLEMGKHVYEGRPGRFLGEPADSQADVVRVAIEDERCLSRFVEREYARLVLTEAPRETARAAARRLEEEPLSFADVVRGWLASADYARRMERRVEVENRVFARSLYVDLFDRLPDDDETRRIRSALDGLGDPGPLRSVLVRILLDSGQVELPERAEIQAPEKWIRRSFLRFYGREPEQAELDLVRKTFREPDCRPATIVYALLSHPEYALR